jgi:hypothetical protein
VILVPTQNLIARCGVHAQMIGLATRPQ